MIHRFKKGLEGIQRHYRGMRRSQGRFRVYQGVSRGSKGSLGCFRGSKRNSGRYLKEGLWGISRKFQRVPRGLRQSQEVPGGSQKRFRVSHFQGVSGIHLEVSVVFYEVSGALQGFPGGLRWVPESVKSVLRVSEGFRGFYGVFAAFHTIKMHLKSPKSL